MCLKNHTVSCYLRFKVAPSRSIRLNCMKTWWTWSCLDESSNTWIQPFRRLCPLFAKFRCQTLFSHLKSFTCVHIIHCEYFPGGLIFVDIVVFPSRAVQRLCCSCIASKESKTLMTFYSGSLQNLAVHAAQKEEEVGSNRVDGAS